MAYMSQENKKSKAPNIKAILKKYNLKGSLSVHNLSTLVLTIKEGAIDFITNYNTTGLKNPYNHNNRFEPRKDYLCVNESYIKDHFTGGAKDCLNELSNAMHSGNHNNSDIQSDYFDVGWYTDIKIGNYDKPYSYIKE